MAIQKVVMFECDDGTLHKTEVLAQQHNAFMHLLAEFQGHLNMFPMPDADQIVNTLYQNRNMVRAYLDLTETMLSDIINEQPNTTTS